MAQIASHVEPTSVKLVHLVTFEMGPVSETLEGFMVLRAPDALRIYGMTETGQKAFEVASLRGKVTRLYRAPFLKDDRVLDLVVGAAQKIFLLRPQHVTDGPSNPGQFWPVERTQEGYELGLRTLTFAWAGRELHLRWLEGDKFSACFMDWTTENGAYTPRRIHFHSEEGPYPYDLRMKLMKASLLEEPPPDSLFEAPP